MAQIVYPLARVLEVKKKRVDEAEKVVREKEKALQLEIEKLEARKKERDAVLKHKKAKLHQLREELDHGTTSPKIQQMKIYLKVVDERLLAEEKKVEAQKEQVTIAEKNLAIAKEELRQKRREVDKLERHREEWMKIEKKEAELIESREMDEQGQVSHLMHQREMKRL